MAPFLLLLRKQEGLSELTQRSLTKTNVDLTSLELNVMFLLGGLKVINSSKKKTPFVYHSKHNNSWKRIEV